MDRAADGVSGEIVHIERFRPDSLTSEGRIAMQSDGQDVLPTFAADAGLLGTSAAHGDRIDGFQVTGIRDEVNFNRAPASRTIFASGADVIFDVAAAQHAARVHILKIGKDLGRGPADDVHHHVQPPAMAHGQDHLLGARSCAGFHNLIQQRNQGGKAFERIALCADKTSLQSLLEEFGANQSFEDVLGSENALAAWFCAGRIFEAIGDPCGALRVRDMHEFGADCAAIDGSGLEGPRRGGVEFEFSRRGGREKSERIEPRSQVAPAAKLIEDAVSLFWAGGGNAGSFRGYFGHRKNLRTQSAAAYKLI